MDAHVIFIIHSYFEKYPTVSNVTMWCKVLFRRFETDFNGIQ